MSYARFAADSDVYVFFNCDGYYECCACRIAWDEHKLSPWVETAEEMLAHMAEHIEKGHKVPDYCTERLRRDIAEGTKERFGGVRA